MGESVGKSTGTLSAVAAHEARLAERIAEAKRRAEAVMASAEADAAAIRGEHEAALAVELGELRRATEQQCREQRDQLLGRANAEASVLRVVAEDQAPAIVDEVLALILPQSRGAEP